MAKLIKAVIIAAILYGATTLGINYALAPFNADQKEQVSIEIPEKTSVGKIAQTLEEANIIRNKLVFKYYVRYKKLDAKLKAGTYRLSPSMSLDEIIAQLQKGNQIYLMFTVPEGYTVQQVAQLLADKGLVNYEKFISLTKTKKFDYPYIKYNDDSINNPLEGYLFPDTYYIPKDYAEEAIITMMLKRFDEIFDQDMRGQAEKLKLSVPEIVTMASLVEKEAKIAEERPVIAGVFYNRLQQRMRLESCATIQYLLGKAKPVLLYEDLKIESPYNTYKNSGLPPGPIANPGRASLLAAVNPDKNDYFYFVAKKDGRHHFSKTLAEHNKAKHKNLP